MSNKDHIEDLFKKRFEKEETPVAGRVWENIKNNLPPEDKQPTGYSWPVVLAVLFFLGSIAAFFISNYKAAEKVESDTKNNKELITENNGIENTKDKTRQLNNSKTSTDSSENSFVLEEKVEDPFIAEEKIKALEIPANEKLNTGNINSIKDKNSLNQKTKLANQEAKGEPSGEKTGKKKISKNITDKNDSSRNLLAGKSNKNQSKDENKKSKGVNILNVDNENAVKSKNNIENKNTNIDKALMANKNISEDEPNNIDYKKGNSTIPAISNGDDVNNMLVENKNTTIEKSEKEEINNKSLNDTSAKSSEDFKNDEFVNGKNKIAMNSDSAANNNSLLSKENKEEVMADTVKPKEEMKIKDSTTAAAEEESVKKKENKSRPFSFDVFVAPAYNYRSLSGNGGEVENKDQYEKSKLSLGGGARVNYSLSDKFSISTGLAYSNYGEKYNYKKDSTNYSITYTNYSTTYIGYYIQDTLTGDSAFVQTDSISVPMDTLAAANTTTEKYKSKNQYKYLSIPLFVTYSFGKGKLNFSLSLGVSVNILVKASASRFNSGTIVQESSSGGNNPFRPVSFSFMISPGIAYDFKERWKLLIQPQLNYFMSSIYKDGSPFIQRPYSLELKAGIRYYLK